MTKEPSSPPESPATESRYGSNSTCSTIPPTHTAEFDLERIQNAVREILLAVGEDPDREGLRETPDRIARMYAELFRGLREDPRIHLRKFFTEEYNEIVLIRDISFESVSDIV